MIENLSTEKNTVTLRQLKYVVLGWVSLRGFEATSVEFSEDADGLSMTVRNDCLRKILKAYDPEEVPYTAVCREFYEFVESFGYFVFDDLPGSFLFARIDSFDLSDDADYYEYPF